jgi:hypothetical protein
MTVRCRDDYSYSWLNTEEGGGGVGPKCADQHREIRDRQAGRQADRRLDRHTPISDKQEELKDRRERQTDEIKIHRQAQKKTLVQE